MTVKIDLHCDFDSAYWTIYPDPSVLRRCIQIEEEGLRLRREVKQRTGSDPGRTPMYDNFPERNSFTVVVGPMIPQHPFDLYDEEDGLKVTDHMPTDGSARLELIVDVNAVIRARTHVLLLMIPRTPRAEVSAYLSQSLAVPES